MSREYAARSGRSWRRSRSRSGGHWLKSRPSPPAASGPTSQSFSRQAFLNQLDYFYTAIENTARTITDFSEKQGFLNTVYERFFQGFNTQTADTHGIVYTPQPIVDFMCASVEEVLKTEFGKDSLLVTTN